MSLSYTSVLVMIEQASACKKTKLKHTKSESGGIKNTLSLFATLYRKKRELDFSNSLNYYTNFKIQ